ncbi:hypothetical protein N310_05050, partial [Acanthisitta chloris]
FSFFAAFSFCFAEVALGVELSPETTSFNHTATSAQLLYLYDSSPHQSTTDHFNSTGSLKTPMSHRTTVQTTDQQQATAASGQHMTAQAGATTRSTTPADNTSAAGQATIQAMHTVTPAVKSMITHSVSSTKQARTHMSTPMTVAATNTSLNLTTAKTQMTADTSTATTTQTVKSSTQSGKETTATKSLTSTAVTNITTSSPRTKTTIPSTTKTRPTPAPQ